MKKSLVPVLFALIPALVLAGCSKKAASKAEGPVTLKVWESDKGPDEFIQKAGEAYTKAHPNVTIEYVHVELGDAAGQIALDGPAGVGPDLFAAPHDKLGELVNSGHVAATVNASTVKGEVLGACSQALTYNGTMYGYPVSAETYALFYNKDLISESELPKTWEDLATFSKKFNAANPGKYGFVMDVGNAYYTIVFTTANGNRLFGPSGTDTSDTKINSEDSVKGMKFFQKTLRPALNVPAADLSTSVADSAFSSGNAAMHITGLWNVKPFVDAGINFGVAALPALPGDNKPCASFSGTRAMFVSAYSEHQEAAAAFAEFLLTPEMQKLRFDITGAMPSINVKVDSPYMPGFIAQLDYAFPMPSIPQMGAYWDAMGNASKNIWDGADVKKELDAANAAILGL
ncbi:MAG: maltose ABC transporter substrate-binding protein [Treponema sp.]|nr:maltose ABC transporter substrate-binding protein [Treponema sp.]